MKIIVLDYKTHRHDWHKKEIKNLYPNAYFKILEELDDNGIKGCNADILLVHQGNIEFSTIEDTPECGKLRIFFGGGIDTYEIYDGDHYESLKKLYVRLEKILLEIDKNNDS